MDGNFEWMTIDLKKFALEYLRSVADLRDTIPRVSRKYVPACFDRTAFIIATAHPTGRYALELVSRDRHQTIAFNGMTGVPSSADSRGLLILRPTSRLESIVFPGTTDESSITRRFTGHAALFGLSFASSEFIANHKPDGFRAQFIGGEVPFVLEGDGGLLVVNITNSYVVNGKPAHKFIEWLRILGSEKLVPTTEAEIRELAIADFSAAVFNIPNPMTQWNFGEFLDSLKGPVDQNVLLLGSYDTEDRFNEAKSALGKLGYSPFLLRDAPDLPIQRNQEKLFAAVMFFSFIVVIDDHASGHIAELATLLQFSFRAMIVIRRLEKPATAFLEDSLLTNDSVRVEA